MGSCERGDDPSTCMKPGNFLTSLLRRTLLHGVSCEFFSAGKVFPKLRRKGRTLPSLQNGEEAEDESTDYVFRIVSKARNEDFCK
jgi:hypothetical protein